ncbi:MAG: DEAD/DEAH box helicase family protein, partial [Sphaerochaetaceae bacterium]|nr:DEAD/DEAH box helicase family protein [Sphaerochaetaceae bacterium]
MNTKLFKVAADYEPAGDQADAIELLSAGVESGFERQTLKGVTGSGKTYTMAKIIEKVQRPTLVLSHNKTLAAQLYREFTSFFPENAVGYFVSTYDYYQPEAYVPGKDLYIEKDADINEEIDRLRLYASFALMERRDVVIVASVSCIFGLGNPMSLRDMIATFSVGDTFGYKEDLEKLVRMQYERNDMVLNRGTFRFRGDVLEICPSYMESAIRIKISWDVIESIEWFDPVSLNTLSTEKSFTLYPAKQFVMPPEQIKQAIGRIRSEMEQQYRFFMDQGKLLEAERIKTRVEYDIEMLEELGYCSGIENYSRPLGNREEGEAPPVLLNYFPDGFLTFIDESHVTLPQIGAMYEGDRSRKLNLVNYGFRLPSALDNRPLKYSEFDRTCGQRIYVSATPGKKEISESSQVVEQVIRPTGLLDPLVEVRPTKGQMEDLYGEIRKT